MSELPEELLEEILCRVPAASLTRSRSTCKRWNGLFNDRRFARKHLDKATKQFRIFMLKEFGIWSMSINLHNIPPVELSLIHPRCSLDQTKICRVSHCDGLLLCDTNNGLVVWNPCTGQTRWININLHDEYSPTYALGSYRDKISNDISYKILSYDYKNKFGIYDMYSKSNAWRIPDVTIDICIIGSLNYGVSFKGKTYWIASEERHVDKLLLVSFDYTTERFERIRLPLQYRSFWGIYLSVVREEKVSVLLQRGRTEIWVTNKIGDETNVVSWSMAFAVDLRNSLRSMDGGSFWIDEEKKVLVCSDNMVHEGKTKVCIVGEDNKVKQVHLEVGSSMSFLFNYVPSLTQI